MHAADHNDQLNALTNALENLAAQRTLEELHLALYIDTNAKLSEMAAMPPLDAVLAAESFFRLQHVYILVHPVDPPPPLCVIPDVWMEHFWSLFPALHAQEKLDVSWYTYDTRYGNPTVETAQRVSARFFALPPHVD